MCHGGSSYTLLSWLPAFFKDSFPDATVLPSYSVVTPSSIFRQAVMW
jgi:hypothetical protein